MANSYGVRIHTLNVGQGDGQFIEVYHKVTQTIVQLILIDAGGSSCLNTIYDYHKDTFQNNGTVYPIDILIITHWDADHHSALTSNINGLTGNINGTNKAKFISLFGPLIPNPNPFFTNTERFKCQIFYADCEYRADLIKWFDTSLNQTILKPPYNLFCVNNIIIRIHAKDRWVESFNGFVPLGTTDKNKSSIGILVKDTYTQFQYYTGGDLSNEEEILLANNNAPYPYINSFKASHHGSATSTSDEFLRNIVPMGNEARIAILSHKNHYSHPTADAMLRIANQRYILVSTNEIDNLTYKVPQQANLYELFANIKVIKQESNLEYCSQTMTWIKTLKLSGPFSKNRHITNPFYAIKNEIIIHSGQDVSKLQFNQSDNPLDRFVLCLKGVDEQKTYQKGSQTWNVAKLPIEYPYLVDIKNAYFQLSDSFSSDDPPRIQIIEVGSHGEKPCSIFGLPISGTIDENNQLNISYEGNHNANIVELFTSLQIGTPRSVNYLLDIFGEIPISKFTLQHNYATKKFTEIHIESTIPKEIIITENLKINNFKMELMTDYKEEADCTLSSNYLSLSTIVTIGEKPCKASWNVLSLPISDFSIVAEDGIQLNDIAKIIPNLDPNQIDEWSQRLNLDKLSIHHISIKNDWENSGALVDFTLGIHINLFKNIQLQLDMLYISGNYAISGELAQKETLQEGITSIASILEAVGIDKNQIDFITPTILESEISQLRFTSNLSSKTYSFEVQVNTDYEITKKFTDEYSLNLRITRVGLEVSYDANTENPFDVKFRLGAIIKSDDKIEDDIDYNNIYFIAQYTNGSFNIGLDYYNFDIKDLAKLIVITLPREFTDTTISYLHLQTNPLKLQAEIGFCFKVEIGSTTLIFKVIDLSAEKNAAVQYSGLVAFLGVEVKFTQTITDTSNKIVINISKLRLSDLMDYFLNNPEMSKHFELDIEKLTITLTRQVSNYKFELASDINELSFGNAVKIKQNTLAFELENTSASIAISTKQFDVIAFEKTYRAQGAIKVGTNGMSFYGGIDNKVTYELCDPPIATSINNIFGIEGLNLEKFGISLNQTFTPPAFAIGFIGQISYKSFMGSTAIYFSPNIPSELLLAVNFNQIRLLDIVESVLDLKGNDGIKKVIESISIESVEFANGLKKEELKQAVGHYDSDTDINDLVIYDQNAYDWLQEGQLILENKKKFRLYFVTQDTVNTTYSLSKYVSLYACTTVNGIELNGVKFATGFAFSGKLNFLGVSQVVNFSATPKEGLFLFYEMEQSINLPSGSGNLLRLSRVEDDQKGPILSLSTYEKDRHFYLSAKLVVLNGVLNFATRVLVEKNSFAFFLYHEVFGFKTSIFAKSEMKTFEQAQFYLHFNFVSSGFAGLANSLKEELYSLSEYYNQQANDALKKLHLAEDEAKKYTRNIQETTYKLEIKYNDLNDLKSVRYPWYRAYKYIELGIRIAAVGVEIAALLIYRLAQIALLEAALAVLELIKEAIKASMVISELVISRLADVIAGLGKGIDWVIKVERIEAELKLTLNNRSFKINPDIRLFGGDTSALPSFYIEHNGNLYEILMQKIRSKLLQQKTALMGQSHENFGSVIDGIYGQGSRLDTSLYNGTFKTYLNADQEDITQFNAYRNIELTDSLDVIFNTFESEKNKDIAAYTNQFDATLIHEIEENLKDVKISLQDESYFSDEVKMKTQTALDDIVLDLQKPIDELRLTNSVAAEKFQSLSNIASLKVNQYGNVIMQHKGKRQQNIEETDRLLNRLGQFSKKIDNFDNVDEYHDLTINANLNEDQSHEEQPDISSMKQIIEQYQSIGENNSISPYYKIIFLTNAGRGLATLGNKEESIRTFKIALSFARETMGFNSNEEQLIKGLSLYYWNEDIDL